MPEITMPRLSDTMEEGVVVSWLKQVGDPVERGEILAEIETDKALMELEAYDSGVLEQILAAEGARVPIGTPIGLIGDGSGTTASGSGGSAPAPAATASGEQAAAEKGSGPASNRVVPESTADAPATAERKKASPLARKIADELGVDITTVTGTGPGGRVIRQDVESAQRTGELEQPGEAAASPEPPAPAPGDYEELPLTTIQRVSATRLTESKQQAPHIYLTTAIDVTELFGFRAQVNATLAQAGGKVSVNDLLLKAVAVTLRSNPSVNVSFAGDKLLRHRGIHLGMAVATPAGLLVPVLRDADRKSVSEIAADSRDKAERARERKLRSDEMSGGTFTISNLGMFGIEHFTAVINPPEAAILAVGAATDELRLDDGQVVTRKILRVTMSADHRAIDGAVAARFLQELKDLLEHPLRIVT
ncbi:dihydrolipoamide acetyltransferase family protein [Nocardia implantans]|uniref:Dihydrolipoamide acetyltransferase component of pyruvate dehydrogenase complex n=1 Tax=Nocardia implantans TaxID=3108168 RepID=A0ABU6AXJ5_9NOCA|nr:MULTISPECIES: dihydrolipoamide acetyltransferase family protein [unclassified Nocardia]MBF6193833.1 2-oxo acid dehydrogenase subunit E2 [Nocardia beijingensis]MEA3529431.1 dihydrolipoamide acetyltransferase family protein [Nocardia sp. CDC192]MEB3512017.1 dihydrolipoamide acetyltransferase family protein [Nocardia sp. CDC186]